MDWRCVECGRTHYRYQSMCKDCGSASLVSLDEYEEREDTPDPDLEPSTDGSRLTPHRREMLKYGAGILGVAAVSSYVVLDETSYPSATAPGDPDAAGGIRFETAEAEIRARVNEKRAANDRDELGNAEKVSAFTEYANKQQVTSPDDLSYRDFDGEFDVSGYTGFRSRITESAVSEFEDAIDLAAAVVTNVFLSPRASEALENPRYEHFGIDLHAGPSGDVFYLAIFH